MGHDIFRNRRDIGALPLLGNLLAPSHSRYIPRSGWTVVAGTAGVLLGTSGMTSSTAWTGNTDDGYMQVTPSFSFPYFGVNRTVFVSTNSYLSFGQGANSYSSFTCTGGNATTYTYDGRGLLIKANDCASSTLYYKDNGNGSFRIRYEGKSPYNFGGANNVFWEITLYDDGKIMLVNGTNDSASGTSLISNDVNDATCLTYTFAINQSFVFEPASGATTYNIYTGASVV